MNVGENIRRIRKEKGLTQKQLAKILNVSEPMISQYETKENLKLQTIRKIAHALDVSISDIVDDWTAFSIDEIQEDLITPQEKEFYKELDKRHITLIYELIGKNFKRTGKYPINLNDENGLDIFLNKKLTKYKTLTNEELKELETSILTYLEFLLEKELHNKEIKEFKKA